VRTHPLRIITELPIESADAAAPSVDVDPGSPALLLVSGGTTGAPKLIPPSPESAFARLRGMASP
jgi:non-ribosomal peptide synthetase component E (peptide arylation enzyme)